MQTNELKSRVLAPQDYPLRPVGMEDFNALLGLINAFSRHFIQVNEMDEAELMNFLTNPEMNMAEDLRMILSPQGNMLGYVECIAWDSPPVHPSVWLRVHPDYLDTDIGQRLLTWADERAQQSLDRCPSELRVSVHNFTLAEAKPLARLLEANSYRLIRHSFQMWVDLDMPATPAQWPPGIELRPFSEERHLEAVYKAYDRSFSDHYGYQKRPFDVGLKRFRHMLIEDDAYDPALWFVAWDGDQVAGFSLSYKYSSEDPNMGWLALLGVPRPWRKRGLGKALLLHTFEEFLRRGKKRVGLGVDAGNLTGALRLYENVGMYVARQYDRYEKELRPGKELMTVELSD